MSGGIRIVEPPCERCGISWDEHVLVVKKLSGGGATDIYKCPPWRVSTRDRFALAALAGILANPDTSSLSRAHKAIAETAYEMADAMLIARDKTTTKKED